MACYTSRVRMRCNLSAGRFTSRVCVRCNRIEGSLAKFLFRYTSRVRVRCNHGEWNHLGFTSRVYINAITYARFDLETGMEP